MTTVGYGDKAPKSVAGRIFSVIWILSGITIFSVLAGQIIQIIMEANAVETRSMTRERVGVLHNRLYDRSLIARNGGTAFPPPKSCKRISITFERVFAFSDANEKGV